VTCQPVGKSKPFRERIARAQRDGVCVPARNRSVNATSQTHTAPHPPVLLRLTEEQKVKIQQQYKRRIHLNWKGIGGSCTALTNRWALHGAAVQRPPNEIPFRKTDGLVERSAPSTPRAGKLE